MFGREDAARRLWAVRQSAGAYARALCKWVLLAGSTGLLCGALGAAFQIRDDMLDVLSTEAELGKPIGSDAEEGKLTFMSLYGEEKCAQMVRRITELAVSLAKELGSDFLAELALRLSDRRS